LKGNKPLLLLCLASLSSLVGMFSLQTVQAFYARDVLGDANYIIVLTLLSTGAIFVVAPVIPRLVRTIGKKRGFLGFGGLGVVAGVGISLAPASVPAIPLFFFGLMGVALAGVNTLMWALEADTVEYGEWKTGVRSEGITYALFSFTRKLGQAVGGALAAYAIAFGGYVAGADRQTETALGWISHSAGLIPAACMLLGIVIFLRYPLTEATFTAMVAETKARREATPTEAGVPVAQGA
jgi:glucuronide carrier protein